jgi:hypothetical protein
LHQDGITYLIACLDFCSLVQEREDPGVVAGPHGSQEGLVEFLKVWQRRGRGRSLPRSNGNYDGNAKKKIGNQSNP